MVIITGHNISKLFYKIPEYEKDLGIATFVDDGNKKGGSGSDYKSSGDWKVKDEVMKTYFKFRQAYPSRIGRIGRLLFYIDYSLRDNRVYVMDDDYKIYQFLYDRTEIRSYISDIIKKVLDGDVKTIEELEREKEERVNLKYMTTEELIEYLSNRKD
jgi:hypothetical protein